jgi:hypothetical protein
MNEVQKSYYTAVIAHALKLAAGPRDADYNKGGIDLRDYWETNGIKSPLQLVDMKVKRALSQVCSWPTDEKGRPCAPNPEQVEKIVESMADAINYAAFTVCEAVSLMTDVAKGSPEEVFTEGAKKLSIEIEQLLK